MLWTNATNPDGTAKKSKKKDVRNLTAQGAEVDPNTVDLEDVKVLQLERKVDALMKHPLYRGIDAERTAGEETGEPDYMKMVLEAHGVM